jgi:hypothetical protein
LKKPASIGWVEAFESWTLSLGMVGVLGTGAVVAEGVTDVPAEPKNLAMGLFEIEKLMADTSKN